MSPFRALTMILYCCVSEITYIVMLHKLFDNKFIPPSRYSPWYIWAITPSPACWRSYVIVFRKLLASSCFINYLAITLRPQVDIRFSVFERLPQVPHADDVLVLLCFGFRTREITSFHSRNDFTSSRRGTWSSWMEDRILETRIRLRLSSGCSIQWVCSSTRQKLVYRCHDHRLLISNPC